MGTLFDVMGSVVAGSLVLITIFTSILNFQEMNYNILVMSNMVDIGENIYRVFDQYYFSNIQSIDVAHPRLFVYKARIDGVVADSIRVEVGKSKTGIGYPLTVRVIDITSKTEKSGAGPYLVADTSVFTYLDASIDTTSTLDNIRNLQMDMIYVHDGWKKNEDTPPIRYFVRILKSFKTIYLNSVAGAGGS